jgi:hypothetical protein
MFPWNMPNRPNIPRAYEKQANVRQSGCVCVCVCVCARACVRGPTVVRVPSYRSRGPGSVPEATRSNGPGTGSPLSLVSTTEELLERKSNGSNLETLE